jgi:hypothetical protein
MSYALDARVGELESRLKELELLVGKATQTANAAQQAISQGGNQQQPTTGPAAGVLYALSPSGGIPGRTSSTCSSASCEIYFKDSTGLLNDTGEALTVFNVSSLEVGAAGPTFLVVAYDTNGDLTTIVESCS